MGNEADKFDYDWKIIQNDDLTRANVILFKNRKTKQINIVIISAQDLKQKRKCFTRHEGKCLTRWC
jgi:hypothetical protein